MKPALFCKEPHIFKLVWRGLLGSIEGLLASYVESNTHLYSFVETAHKNIHFMFAGMPKSFRTVRDIKTILF